MEMMDGCFDRVWNVLTGVRVGGEWINDGYVPGGKKELATGRERVGRKDAWVESLEQIYIYGSRKRAREKRKCSGTENMQRRRGGPLDRRVKTTECVSCGWKK